MFAKMPFIETDISILDKARKKFETCPHKQKNFDENACKLYHYRMDSNMDILHHCGTCSTNTKEPSYRYKARFS